MALLARSPEAAVDALRVENLQRECFSILRLLVNKFGEDERFFVGDFGKNTILLGYVASDEDSIGKIADSLILQIREHSRDKFVILPNVDISVIVTDPESHCSMRAVRYFDVASGRFFTKYEIGMN